MGVICERCRDLRFSNAVRAEIMPSEKHGTMVPEVTDRKQMVDDLFKEIYPRSIIIYVCDVSNFEGSIIPEIFKKLVKDRHRIIIAANKIDALTDDLNVGQLQQWVKTAILKQIAEVDPDYVP